MCKSRGAVLHSESTSSEVFSSSQGCHILSPSSSGDGSWAGSSSGSPAAAFEAKRQKTVQSFQISIEFQSFQRVSEGSPPGASRSARAWRRWSRTPPCSRAWPRTCWPGSRPQRCSRCWGSRFCPDRLGGKKMQNGRVTCKNIGIKHWSFSFKRQESKGFF